MLVVDIGNTHTKYSYSKMGKVNQLRTHSLLNDDSDFDCYKIVEKVIIVSSVLSADLTSQVIRKFNQHNQSRVYVLKSADIFAKMLSQNEVHQFEHIGIDRALKIFHMYSLPSDCYMSIGCGTAFTIEVMQKKKFIDSYILPGFFAQQSSLLKNANQINNLDYGVNLQKFANTSTSVYKGILFSYVGLVELILRKYNVRKIFISGNYGSLLSEHLFVHNHEVEIIPYYEIMVMHQFADILIANL